MNKRNFIQIARMFHTISLFLVAAVAGVVLAYTALSAVGLVPWLTFSATFGDVVVSNAGQLLQIFTAIVVTSFAFFLPTNARIVSLENSHRNFNMKMEDVARAYHYCHTADRSGVFTLSSEFDAVRERLAYLRDHPDLEMLEPDVLEVAAQMSQQARQLADVYNDEKVNRAKAFLQQRQEEVERQQDRIVQALHDCGEIKKWSQQIEIEEAIVASQLNKLEEKLQSTLPELGYSIERTDTNIVPMKPITAAE